MWRSDDILKMLPEYEKCKYTGEIILIDNAPELKPDLSQFKKLRYYTKGKNIYVNPAWNWGAELANYNIILANDDILVKDSERLLKLISECDYDILGILLKEQEGDMHIRKLNHWPSTSYGCFMYVRHYKRVPDELLIWYGDRYLFKHNKKQGRIINSGIHTNPSTTIDSDKEFFRKTIGRQDIINKHRLVKEGKF